MGISDTIPPWAQIKRPTYSPGPFTYGNYVERAAATIYSTNARFYPLNPSLEEECSRLFSSSIYNKVPPTPVVKQVEDVWADFRRNGKDYEYCPDDDTPPVVLSKKKNKKPLATECVFCKNNGEDIKIYKTHILKDADGRVLCPILRKYTCPICGEKGDQAHTIKYCPANKYPHVTLASMNCLKNLRNSTGRRRSK